MIPEPDCDEKETEYIDRCFLDRDVIAQYPDATARYELICMKWWMRKEINLDDDVS